MITGSEKDELIFDYLEGNLSESEREAFLILKDESELMHHEVRLWEKAYLNEPLPLIEELEKKLLIEPKTGGFFSRIYLNLLIISFSVFISADKAIEQRIIDSPVSGSWAIEQPILLAAPEAPISGTSGTGFLTPKETLSSRTNEGEKESKIVPYSIKKFNVQEIEADFAPEINVDISGVVIKPLNESKARKKWSRQERRQIMKKLWNDLQTREANEFLKGNVPYVVPLSNNNF